MKARLHGDIPAPEATLTVLGEVTDARVIDHDCRKPHGARGSYEYSLDYGLVLVRRGGYWREVNGKSAYVGPTDVFFERPHVEQRIEHQGVTGDRSTSLWMSQSAISELAGDTSVPDDPIATTPEIDLLHRQLVVALRRGIDRFELEERLARLVGAVADRAAPGRLSARRSATRDNHHHVVQLAREAIVADPAGADLRELGKALGYTRFHISRVFSRATGVTLSQFRNQVRVALALDQLAEGRDNLASLASDLGFVDQSHFSRVVRAQTGERPGVIRQRLGYGKRSNGTPSTIGSRSG